LASQSRVWLLTVEAAIVALAQLQVWYLEESGIKEGECTIESIGKINMMHKDVGRRFTRSRMEISFEIIIGKSLLKRATFLFCQRVG
jgi:hypothetical protein